MNKISFLLLILISVFIATGDLACAENLTDDAFYYSSALRSVISLLIVIGMIYFTAWVYKHISKFNNDKFIKKESLWNKFKIVSSQSLGGNKNLYLVEINGKYLVLAATQQSITLIKEFDKDKIDKQIEISASLLNIDALDKTSKNELKYSENNVKDVDIQWNEILEKYKKL